VTRAMAKVIAINSRQPEFGDGDGDGSDTLNVFHCEVCERRDRFQSWMVWSFIVVNSLGLIKWWLS
jgi:hypothetical protein